MSQHYIEQHYHFLLESYFWYNFLEFRYIQQGIYRYLKSLPIQNLACGNIYRIGFQVGFHNKRTENQSLWILVYICIFHSPIQYLELQRNDSAIKIHSLFLYQKPLQGKHILQLHPMIFHLSIQHKILHCLYSQMGKCISNKWNPKYVHWSKGHKANIYHFEDMFFQGTVLLKFDTFN